MSIIEAAALIVGFLLGMCVLYFTAYSRAKRKIRALQKNVTRLEDEKEKVLAKHITEKEKKKLYRDQFSHKQEGIKPAEIEKPLAVDIKKKECPYDEKRQQFVNYFTLLDEFHRRINDIFTLQFHPILNRFLASNSVKDALQNYLSNFCGCSV